MAKQRASGKSKKSSSRATKGESRKSTKTQERTANGSRKNPGALGGGTIGPVGSSHFPLRGGTIGPVGSAYDPRDFGHQVVMPDRRRFGMGWHRDLPDFRDTSRKSISPKINQVMMHDARGRKGDGQDSQREKYWMAYKRVRDAIYGRRASSLSPSFDNSDWCSPIEDQGPLGSCTAQAAAGMMEYMQRRAFNKHEDTSRLFIYKMTRKLLRWTGDTGAYLRTTMKALALFGAPPESENPYVIDNYDDEPDSYLYSYAANYKALQYFRLDPQGVSQEDVLQAIKSTIAQGYVVMFGFAVFSSLTDSAYIPFPSDHDSQEGGHAVLGVGYDDEIQCPNASKGALLIRNSWGTGWGGDEDTDTKPGYGWLPYDYVLSALAADFWVGFKFDWVETGQFD